MESGIEIFSRSVRAICPNLPDFALSQFASRLTFKDLKKKELFLQERDLVLALPENGTRLRIIEFPPEGEEIRKLTGSDALAKFKSMGGEKASTSTRSLAGARDR